MNTTVLGWYGHGNCFAGNTKFLTSDGAKTLFEMVGKTCKVLTTRCKWVDAEIKSFGVQKVIRVELEKERFRQYKVIYVTADHRWPVIKHNNYFDITTADFRQGTRLVSVLGHGVSKNIRLSSYGIAHGIVFGDGNKNSVIKSEFTNPASLVLCGNKDAELVQYFPLSPKKYLKGIGKSKAIDAIKILDLPRYFKDQPSLSESKSYLFGWLAGYFAADGHVSKKGECRIVSTNFTNMQLVKDVCVRLGIGCSRISSEIFESFGKKRTAYIVRFIRHTLRSDFFLLKHHKERAIAAGFEIKRRAFDWKVVSVTDENHEEEVFCPIVPGTHRFVLEDNILTGNCGDEAYKVAFPVIFPDHQFTFTDVLTNNCERVFLGGGDVLQKSFMAQLAKTDAPKYAMSVNLKQKNIGLYHHIFKQLFVRNVCQADDKVLSVPDFSFVLQANPERGKEIIKSVYQQYKGDLYNKVIVVVLNAYLCSGEAALARDHINFDKVCYDLAKIMDTTSASFLMVSFGNGFPNNDRLAASPLYTKCKFWKKNVVLFKELSVQGTLDVVSAANMLIGSRLHASIFACIGGTPFIDLTHHDKTTLFLESINKDWGVNYWNFNTERLKVLMADFLVNEQKYKEELLAISKKNRELLLDLPNRLRL